MKSQVATRTSSSLAVAILLSLALAGQTMAVTWNAPIALTSADATSGDLVTLGSSTAVAAYSEAGEPEQLFVRRSTSSGASWETPQALGNGMFAALAGRGMHVDLIWNRPSGRVLYATSTDGGASFGSPVALSPVGRFAWQPSVARGPAQLVAVVWEDVVSGYVNVRVSQDGGVSFAAPKVLTTAGEEMGTAVAIGDGVIYVAYSIGSEEVRLRRSLDSGLTWRAPVAITNRLWDDGISLTAAGSHAYMAYTTIASGSTWSKVGYRQTTDRGANWSSQMDLSPPTWTSSEPDMALQGGVLRAVFTRCTPEIDVCIDERIFYRESSNGTSWSTAQRVSPNTLFAAYSPHAGFAGKVLVLYLGDGSDGILPYVRAGTP